MARSAPLPRLAPAGGDGYAIVAAWSAVSSRYRKTHPALRPMDPTADALEIHVTMGGVKGRNIATVLPVCSGQAVWAARSTFERTAGLWLQGAGIESGVSGEMDGQSLHARSKSFAAAFAEYARAMWHDVTVRSRQASVSRSGSPAAMDGQVFSAKTRDTVFSLRRVDAGVC